MSAIGYKSHKVLIGTLTHAWHPKLIELLLWLTVRHSHLTITSAYREKPIHSSDSGIHSSIPLRAFDLRSRDFEDPVKVRNDINQHCIYDPDRPWLNVAIYHNSGMGFHFHLQIHENSKVR